MKYKFPLKAVKYEAPKLVGIVDTFCAETSLITLYSLYL